MTSQNLHNLFFALWPDAEVRKRLNGLQEDWPGDAGRMHHPQDLHMTLVFLGKVIEEQMPCVLDAASGISSEPFALELTKSHYWKRPKILWCGPDHTPEPLMQLVSGLQNRLKSCGFEPEKRTYKPHVTLARKAKPHTEKPLGEKIIWRPMEFVLAGSHSGAKPPRYRVLQSWKIGV